MPDTGVESGALPSAAAAAEPPGAEKPAANPEEERKLKLAALRLRMTKAKNQNSEAALEEFRRKTEGEESVNKRIRKQQWEERVKEEEEDKQRGILAATCSPELRVTAKHEAERDKKRRKKEEMAAPMGWDVFNVDTQYTTAKKREERMLDTFGKDLTQKYQRDKATLPEGQLRPDTERNVDFGAVEQPTEEMRARVQAELALQQSKRSKFSRRRAHMDDEDVTFINERNKRFNEKLRRAFDPFTTEIRQSLERGTAL
eukprot:Hpha_TRINITY_DN25222_c0_g1::TRINITY_DN25222_c0_g1_i1::g.110793::m.110793/K12868/SYF2; pre-mRNA-splicing factor SYF2